MGTVSGDDGRSDFASALSEQIAGRVAWLAEQLGLSEQAVRDWMSGKSVPAPDRVFEIERALGLEPGELSHSLGYTPVGPPPDVIRSIRADGTLRDDAKKALVSAYKAMLAVVRDSRNGS